MEDEDVIFEGSLLKLNVKGAKKKSSFSSKSGSWKERYFILKRQQNRTFLNEYKKKPLTTSEKPAACLHLWPKYSVLKRGTICGKDHTVQLTTEAESLVLATHSERFRDMFVFYLQTQTQLRDNLILDCFNVRPEDSEDQRKIGARGSLCLLHISQWGVTLCLSLSRAILAQWPLRCIRFYQASGKGHFQIEAGHRAPMGPGIYNFNTRKNEDNRMYDILDDFVNKAIGLSKRTNPDADEAVAEQHSNMADLSMHNLNNQFDQHHSRISTDNYTSVTKEPSVMRQTSSSNQENIPLPIKNIRPSIAEPRVPPNEYLNVTPEGAECHTEAPATAKHREALKVFIPPQSVDVDSRPKLSIPPQNVDNKQQPKVFQRPLARSTDPLDIKAPINDAFLRKEQPHRRQPRTVSEHSASGGSVGSEISFKSEYMPMTPNDDFLSSFSPSNSTMMSPPPTFYEIMNAEQKDSLTATSDGQPQASSPGYADMRGSMSKLSLDAQSENGSLMRPGGMVKQRKVTDSLPPLDGTGGKGKFRFNRMKSSSSEDFTELKRNTLYNWNHEYDNVTYVVDEPHTYDEAAFKDIADDIRAMSQEERRSRSPEETRFAIADIRKMFSLKSKQFNRSMSNPNIVDIDFSSPVTNKSLAADPVAVKPASNFTPTASSQKERKQSAGVLGLSLRSKSKKKGVSKEKPDSPKVTSSSKQLSIKGITPSNKSKSFTKKKPLTPTSSNQSHETVSQEGTHSATLSLSPPSREFTFPPSQIEEQARKSSLVLDDERPLICKGVESPPQLAGGDGANVMALNRAFSDSKSNERPMLGRRLPSLPQSETWC